MKLTKSALKTLLKSLAPAPEDDAGAAENAAENEEDGEDASLNDLDDFINNDNVPGLDDHPDLEFSPVFMYKIKVAKEEARKEMRRQQLLTEGYDPDQMDEADASAAAVGSTKQNALATLIEAGARVTPIAASQGAEAKVREDRRRQIKTIETYLNKNLELDTTKKSLQDQKTAYSSKGKKYLSALDAARLTTIKRAGNSSDERSLTVATTYAKAGRNQLRDLMVRDPKKFQEIAFGGDDEGMSSADLDNLVLTEPGEEDGEEFEGEEQEENDGEDIAA